MARKNGNGEGSRPRERADGRWEARYWVGEKRRSVYGSSRKEAADKLAKAIAHKDEPPPFKPASITVGEFFGQYDDVARDAMKRRSYETSKDIIRLHILPEFATKKLKDLNREQVQRLYRSKRDAGLSAARVRRIHGVLSSALNTAVRWRLIERNVCREVSPPKVEQPEIRPFSLEEAKTFLAVAESDRYAALFVLGLTSGARFGELAGLYWSDLDLDRRVSDNGVRKGMKFRVLADTPTEVKDPDTDEVIGLIDREKVRVQTVEVQDRIAICRTYETVRVGGGISSIVSAVDRINKMNQPARDVPVTLRAGDESFLPDLPESESYVKRGDRVAQFDDP